MSGFLHYEIADRDVRDWFGFVAIVVDSVGFCLLCCDVADMEIGVAGREVAATIAEVVGLETEHSTLHFSYADAIHMYRLYESSAIEIGLEEEGVLHVAYLDVVHEDIAHTTRHLRTDAETVALAEEMAVADDDILGRAIHSATVGITSRLDGYGIIACAEGAVFYQHSSARFGVATVVIGEVGVDSHSTNCHVFAVERMNAPEGTILQSDALDENLLAVV